MEFIIFQILFFQTKKSIMKLIGKSVIKLPRILNMWKFHFKLSKILFPHIFA